MGKYFSLKPAPTVAENKVAVPCPKCGTTGFFCLGVHNDVPYSNTGFVCWRCNGVGWQVISKRYAAHLERISYCDPEIAARNAAYFAQYEAEREAEVETKREQSITDDSLAMRNHDWARTHTTTYVAKYVVKIEKLGDGRIRWHAVRGSQRLAWGDTDNPTTPQERAQLFEEIREAVIYEATA
ncbi:MAG: hypothetical protein KDE24_20605 [Caldilinea sp.]|nr:hypothetical protein [Caldilinea sp.]